MLSSLEDFHASLESIPNVLKRKYALIRDLDKSSQEIQRQNEERCEREIEIIKQSIRVGIVRPDSSLICFSEEALEEQKHSLRIVDEKIALAIQAYDLVDSGLWLGWRGYFISRNGQWTIPTKCQEINGEFIQVDNHVQQLDQYLRKANEEQLQGFMNNLSEAVEEYVDSDYIRCLDFMTQLVRM